VLLEHGPHPEAVSDVGNTEDKVSAGLSILQLPLKIENSSLVLIETDEFCRAKLLDLTAQF
jgi:hypothetical protein